MTNLVHILGVCLIVAGLIVGALAWRHFRRPVPPAPPPDPYSEPGSLFRPPTSDGRRP